MIYGINILCSSKLRW